MALTREQLESMSVEDLQQLQQQQQGGGGFSLPGALRGAFQGFTGQQLGTKTPLATEQLAQLKLDREVAEAQEKTAESRAKTQEAQRKAGLFGGGQEQPIAAPSIQPAKTPGEIVPPSTQSNFIEVPTGRSETGEIETKIIERPEVVQSRELKGKESAKAIETKFKQEGAQKQAETSFKLVGGAAKGLADVYSNAVKEGGAGSLTNSLKTKAVLGLGGNVELLGIDPGKLRQSSAFPGKKTEFLIRMMPILTQQGDKPGSVRLIRSIFEKLGVTLPGLQTAPENARDQIAETIKNMFQFARAYNNIATQRGLTNDEIENELSGAEVRELGDEMLGLAGSIVLSPQEEVELNRVLQVALEPIDNLILERGEEQQQDDIRSISDEELRAIAGVQ